MNRHWKKEIERMKYLLIININGLIESKSNKIKFKLQVFNGSFKNILIGRERQFFQFNNERNDEK